MTMRADLRADCDRCGADVGNGGLDKCVAIAMIVEPGDRVENLHLCTISERLLDARDGSPEPQRCATRVLTKAALAHYVANVGEAGVNVVPFDSMKHTDSEG